jgi:hypothetical protein
MPPLPSRPLQRPLSRRAMLRGALGGAAVTVGLPPLEAMLNLHGTALAGGRPLPRRLGVWFWGNGVRLDKWVPKERGRRWKITEQLAPLAAFKKYINVVSGMNIHTGNEQGHHAGTVGILSGCPMVSQPHPTSAYASTFSGPSIDQVAADVIGRATPFRSLEVGVSRRVTENEGTTLLYLSHRGPDNPNPPEYDAEAVFDRLFGAAGRPGTGAAPGQSALASSRALGRSVLDVVAEDARALERQVGANDRRRLDQHLDNIRDIEKRVITEWRRPAQCQVGAWPATFREEDGKEPLAEINEAMSRLVAVALSCDMTRVFSVMFSGSVANTIYWQVGEDKNHHQFTHDEPGDQPIVHAATIFIMKQFARLLEHLRSTPDGAGNLLDSCAILASSDTAQGKEHTIKDYPILVVGRARGALKYPGIHHRSDKGENATRVLLSVLRAAGVALPELGKRGGKVDESLTAIEA